MNSQDSYRILFSEIISGLSSVSHSFFGRVFIKHFSYLETGNLDSEFNIYLSQYTDKGIPTYKIREKEIIENGFWTQTENDSLTDNLKLISNLRINISKDYLYTRRQNLKDEIKKIEKDINKLRIKKEHYIGETAEYYANKKLTYYKIENSYFKDRDCKIKLLENDEIEDDKYGELIQKYNDFQEKFSGETIKKIAISPFFTNIFYLSEDNAYYFYGKPIINLTMYQSDLFSLGRYFKNILSNNQNIPGEVRNNPDELMEWIEIQNNAKEQKIIGNDNDEGGGAGSIVGANKRDLEVLGIQIDTKNSLSEKLKKNKGIMTKDDLLKEF